MKYRDFTTLLRVHAPNVIKPASVVENDRRALFMLAQKPGTYLRASYSVVSQEYVDFFIRRSHYFAYLNKIVSKGWEGWTNTLGKSQEEKVETLHAQLKDVWASVHSRPIFGVSDDAVGKKGMPSYRDIQERLEWMMENLASEHFKLTEKETGTGWTISPWGKE
jgi:hypothetical protein